MTRPSKPSFRTEPVRIRVPATSANLGPGFDAFGLALTWYDELHVSVTESGLEIDVQGEGADVVPRDERHTVVTAMRATFDRLGGHPPGLRLTCRNRIPHGRGLGSSAAAISAGVVAARALVERSADPLDATETLALATALEGHPDNVAACLFGGLTLAWRDDTDVHAVRLEPALLADAAVPVAFVPSTELATTAARGLLPPSVPHGDAAHTAARAGLLVAALTGLAQRGGASGDAAVASVFDRDLLLAATDDRLHQAYRAAAMPASAALLRALRYAGVPATVSGAGPTVLALVPRAEVDQVLAWAGEEPAAGFAARALAVDATGAEAWTSAGIIGVDGALCCTVSTSQSKSVRHDVGGGTTTSGTTW